MDRTGATTAPLYQECAATITTPLPTVTRQPNLPVAADGSVPQLIALSGWENGKNGKFDGRMLDLGANFN